MHLRYYIDPKTNKRVYTLKQTLDEGAFTFNAHPAKFSPDDKFSRERITCKERFNIMLKDCNEFTGK